MIFADIALQLSIFLGIGMAEARANDGDSLTAILEAGILGWRLDSSGQGAVNVLAIVQLLNQLLDRLNACLTGISGTDNSQLGKFKEF